MQLFGEMAPTSEYAASGGFLTEGSGPNNGRRSNSWDVTRTAGDDGVSKCGLLLPGVVEGILQIHNE